MADTVNPQITDSITEVNVEVVGMAPGVAMAGLYQATAHAQSISAYNNTLAQAMGANLMIASTGVGVAVLNRIAASIK